MKAKFYLSLVFISGLLFYCYEFYLRILPGAYADQIMTFFKSGPFDYSFLVSSYNLTYLAMQIPAGLLLDRLGNRRVLVIAVLLCGIGNSIFVFDNYNVSVLGRLIVGLGSSFAFVAVLKLCREYLSQRYFAFLASIVISVGTLAAAYAQQISTVISVTINWREVFVYSGLVSIFIAIFIWISLRKNQKSFQSSKSFPSLRTSLLQSTKLLKNRGIWLTALIGGLLYVPTVVLTAQWGVYFFEHQYGLTQEMSAEAVTYLLWGWVIFSPVVGFLADRFAKEKALIYIFGLISIALLFIIMYRVNTVGQSAAIWSFLFGCSAAVQVLIWRFFNQICPMEYTGVGVAILNMLITFLTEIFQLVVGSMMEWKSGIKWFEVLTGFCAPIQFASVSMFACILLALILLPFLNIKKTSLNQNENF